MCVFSLLRYHQVYSWYFTVSFTDPVRDYLLIFPSKHINGKILILPLQPVNLQNRRWEVNACEIQAVFC